MYFGYFCSFSFYLPSESQVLWFFERCELLAEICFYFSASVRRGNTWYMFGKLDLVTLKIDSATNLISVLYELFLKWKYVTICPLASLYYLHGHDNSTVIKCILTKFDIAYFFKKRYRNIFELGYNIMKGTEYFVIINEFCRNWGV